MEGDETVLDVGDGIEARKPGAKPRPSRCLKLYAATLAVFLAMDVIWIGLVARGLYERELDFLMKDDPNWTAALLFYLLFVFGILVYVVVPGRGHGSPSRVLLAGAGFGLITYATYGLPNLAVIEAWPAVLTIIDLVWGALAGALTGLAGFLSDRRLSPGGPPGTR
jgi:uncharacterized membrane protein